MLINLIIKEYIIQYIENGVVAQKNIFRHLHWLLRSLMTRIFLEKAAFINVTT